MSVERESERLNIGDEIRRASKDVQTLGELEASLLGVLTRLRENGYSRITYVSGVITSEGLLKTPQNFKKLAQITEEIRRKHDFPVFSAGDVLSIPLILKLRAFGGKDWISFWRGVLVSGTVTDLVMTPGWEDSKGARIEKDVADQVGIRVYETNSSASFFIRLKDLSAKTTL